VLAPLTRSWLERNELFLALDKSFESDRKKFSWRSLRLVMLLRASPTRDPFHHHHSPIAIARNYHFQQECNPLNNGLVLLLQMSPVTPTHQHCHCLQ
jgi:hypothetical protein